MSKRKTRAKSPAAGKDIRSKVRNLTLRAVRDRDVSLRDLPKLAGDVLHGAAAGLERAMPRAARSPLRQVVDGLTDAVAAVADATRLTASATARRGKKFVRHDVHRAARDLSELETRFLHSLHRAAQAMSDSAKAEVQSVVDEAKRAGTKIRPAVRRALSATEGNMAQMGQEAAQSGVRAARGTVGAILQGSSGLLEGLGQAVSKPKRAKAKSKPKRKASRPGARRKTGKRNRRSGKS